MSYNITGWIVKKMENLRIPISALTEVPYVEIHIRPQKDGSNPAVVSGLSEQDVTGYMDEDQNIVVTKFLYADEGSGSNWDALREILSHSIGTLIAIQVWEGGGSFTKLTVIDGNVTVEDIEL